MPLFIESDNYKAIVKYKAQQLARQAPDPNLTQRVCRDIRQATSPETVMLTLDRWVHVLVALPQSIDVTNFSISHAVYSGIIEAIQGTPLQTYLPGMSSDYLNRFATLDQQYSASTSSDDMDGIGLFIGEGSEHDSPIAIARKPSSTDSMPALERTTVVEPASVQLVETPAFNSTVIYLQHALLADAPDIPQLLKAFCLWVADSVTTAFAAQSQATLAQSMAEQMGALVQGSTKDLNAATQAHVLFGWWKLLCALHENGHDCVVDALLAIEEIQNSCPFEDKARGETVKGNADTLKLFLTLTLPPKQPTASFSVIQQFEKCRQAKEAVASRVNGIAAILSGQDFLSVSTDLFIELYEKRQEAVSKGDGDSEQMYQDWLGRLWQIYEAVRKGEVEASTQDFIALELDVRLHPFEQQMDELQLDINSIQIRYATISSEAAQLPLELFCLLKAVKDWPIAEATVANPSEEISIYSHAFLEIFLANEALVSVVLANSYAFSRHADSEDYEALKTFLKEQDFDGVTKFLLDIFIESLQSWQVEYVFSNQDYLEYDYVDQGKEEDEAAALTQRLTSALMFPSTLRMSQSSQKLDPSSVVKPSLLEKCIEIFEMAHRLTNESEKMAFYLSLQKGHSRDSPVTAGAKHALLQDFSKRHPREDSAKAWRKIIKGCEQLGYQRAKDFSQLDQVLMVRLQLFIMLRKFLEKNTVSFSHVFSSLSLLEKLSGLTPMMQVMTIQHYVNRHPISNSAEIWKKTQQCLETLKVSASVKDITTCLEGLLAEINRLCVKKSNQQVSSENLEILGENLVSYIVNQLPLLNSAVSCLIPGSSSMGSVQSMGRISSSPTPTQEGVVSRNSEIELMEKLPSPPTRNGHSPVSNV